MFKYVSCFQELLDPLLETGLFPIFCFMNRYSFEQVNKYSMNTFEGTGTTIAFHFKPDSD